MLCTFFDCGVYYFTISYILMFGLVYAENSNGDKTADLAGRYTRILSNYHLAVPRKVDAAGRFESFKIPHFYKRNLTPDRHRRKRSADDAIHYQLEFAGRNHHLVLWPNDLFMAPNLLVEYFAPNPRDRRLRQVARQQCHYTGNVRGIRGSKAALSLCDGMTGLVATERGQYLVEPVHGHGANMLGQHLHVVHARDELQEATPHAGGPASAATAGVSSGVHTPGVCGTSPNWTNSWADRFRDQYSRIKADDAVAAPLEDTSAHARRDLKIGAKHRYVEVLIVADKKFLDWHRDSDYEGYLLTIMNMVSNYYHDASVGNMIDVVVSRIIYLDKEEEEIDLDISPDADKTLKNFCEWQKKINFGEEHPNHHDIAALITRHNICSSNADTLNCGLLGLAYVSGVCKSTSCCSINQDSGLQLGIVITHEVGHLLGSGHDTPGESACAAQNADGFYNIMSPYIKVATTVWSSCSKAFITSLMNYGLGDCLLDEPAESRYQTIDVLPGVVYDMDFQCKSMPSKRGACGFKSCNAIMCYLTDTGCGYYPDNPPFDGTTCGNNKWCFKKECVAKGERPKAVNGGWGAWGTWSECSRTCGGGVKLVERQCDTPRPVNGGKFCVGEHKQMKMCNIQKCPRNTKSFKDFQCATHDTANKKHESYIPREKLESCQIYCLLLPSGPYTKYPADDGTRCKGGTKNVCVSNACQAVGCDWEFESDAFEDRCGVCRGDGTSCTEVKGIFIDKPSDDVDYMEIVHIPKGSRSINIAEQELSPSYIMLSTEPDTSDGSPETLLNEINLQEDDISKDLLGSIVLYTHQKTGLEKLWMHEPIEAPLIVWLVALNFSNPGYSWSYMRAVPESDHVPVYHWETVQMSPCDHRCGGGTQEELYDCVESVAGKVDVSLCEKIVKPKSTSHECNMQPCKTKWKVSGWGACTGCQLRIGFKKREVECTRESHIVGGEDMILEAVQCNDTKPHTMELCNSMRSCEGVNDPFETVRKKAPTFGTGHLQVDHISSNLWQQAQMYPRMALYAYGDHRSIKLPWALHRHYLRKKTCRPSTVLTHIELPAFSIETTTESSSTSSTVTRFSEVTTWTTLDSKAAECAESKQTTTCTPTTEDHYVDDDDFDEQVTKPPVVGTRVKDYDTFENLRVIEETTKNVPNVRLNEKAYEEMGADVEINNSGTDSTETTSEDITEENKCHQMQTNPV